MNEQNSVKIHVYGKEYTIKSPQNPEVTKEYAAYIDNLMREVAKKTGSLDTTRIAILALLQVTHELFTLRKKQDADTREFDKKMEELLKEINNSMSKSGVQTEMSA